MPHAILSPSSSARWLTCTPSARAEEAVPNRETTFAREGTLAHELCETVLRAYLESDAIAAYDAEQLADAIVQAEGTLARAQNIIEALSTEGFNPDEAIDAAARYTQIVWSEYLEARRTDPDAELFIEAPLDLKLFVPQSFGTTDSAFVAGNTLHVFDFKYGRGVKVSAEDNSQMKLYALGALFGPGEPYDIKFVEMTIIQPRIGNYSTWSISADELTDWGWTVLAPTAKVAFMGEGAYVPGNHCHFCRVASRCRALAESVAVTVTQGARPELMEPDEIAAQLSSLEMVENWVKSIKEYSLNAMLEGRTIPGWKAVEGRATSKVSDEAALLRSLDEAGIAPDLVTRTTLLPLGELKRTLGAAAYKVLVAPSVTRTAGKPTIAPESDPREAYRPQTAEDAFNNL